MKTIFAAVCALMIFPFVAATQNIGISEDSLITPASSSLLELRSASKGILIPRMLRSARTSIASPANGLLVYQTDSIGTENRGFWYYSSHDASWHNLGSPPVISSWNLTGNSTIDTNSNFLGTTTSFPIIVKTNNSEIARFLANGNLGIGTPTAAEKLDVRGNLALSNTGTASALILREPSASGTNYTALKARTQSADVTYNLPIAQGTSYTYLENDGTGNLRWTDTIRTKAVYYSSPIDYNCIAASQTITIQSTYYRINSNSTPNSRILRLNNGIETGNILYITCVTGSANGFRMQASDPNLKLNTGTNLDFNNNDAAVFMWSGTYWILLSFSDNQ